MTETTPEPTLAGAYAHLATQLDDGEHPDITIPDVLRAISEMAPEVFADAIRAGTDRLLAEKLPAIEVAARAAERRRILEVAERLKEPHRQPGTSTPEYAVPLSLLRAELAGSRPATT